jgi:hypothetical protein
MLTKLIGGFTSYIRFATLAIWQINCEIRQSFFSKYQQSYSLTYVTDLIGQNFTKKTREFVETEAELLIRVASILIANYIFGSSFICMYSHHRFFMYRLHGWWTAKSWCFTMRIVLVRYRLSFIIIYYWSLVKHTDGYRHRKGRRDHDIW